MLVIGCAGSGKTTLSRRLSYLTDLPVIHLDRHYWHHGWKATEKDDWSKIVAELIRKDEWIMDGNYGGTMAQRIEASDTVIFLKFPRTTCMWRVIQRRIKSIRHPRPDLPEGCPDRFEWQFLRYIWNYPAARGPRILKGLGEIQHSKRVEVLDSDTAVERFLMEFKRR